MLYLACICGGTLEFLLILPIIVVVRYIVRKIFKCKICDCPCHEKDTNGKTTT